MRKDIYAKPTLCLALAGILLNIVLVGLTKQFDIPLYLDSIGTVLVAALGGMLPGIAVGFFSNCITAFASVSPDPMTMYYGFLSVLLAIAAAQLSRRGLLLKWYGRIMALLLFTMIGGALGSVVTWMLYGFSFGQGISAPLAQWLFLHCPLDEFSAQFSADMILDAADKLLTVTALCTALDFCPEAVRKKLPLGYLYRKENRRISLRELKKLDREQMQQQIAYRKRSINTKITGLLLLSSLILSVLSLVIGLATYQRKMVGRYSGVCESVVQMMLPKIDGDKIEQYLLQGEADEEYRAVEANLREILDNAADIKYMYVYAIREDGCHVVFDLDTEQLAGAAAGTVVPFDDTFPYTQQLLAGQEIPAVITNDTYGWLMTVYKPVRSSAGSVVAYAAADIDMRNIQQDIWSFLISIASLLFGVMILNTMVSIWYCDRSLLEPIDVLAKQARNFDFTGTHKGSRIRDRYAVQTGDELEEVFHAMCRTEDEIAQHIDAVSEKSREISQMQRNIIYTLANMVENRDSNTGGHIRRTAGYVRLIGQKLLAAGLYPETVDADYIKKLYDSAPLHDIGKIKIPDAILNKPGRLTEEEFEVMKTHTTEGGHILRTSLSEIEDGSWLAMAIDMALYHHEKWNGSGYPEGRQGMEIPLCARIMAVADVFDALVTVRSYKAAMPFAEAMQIIREGSGTHFDPEIVTVFVASEAEIHAILGD